MNFKHSKLIPVAMITGAALGGATFAGAATKHQTSTTTSTTEARAPRGNGNEKELTGATLKSATDAAIAANPGATVERAATEDPAEKTGAAYEVKITKADGTDAEVLEDSSFKVLSTKADAGHGGHGDHDGHGRGGNPNEKALTGTDLAKAKSAATAAVAGLTVDNASAEDAGENSGAAYEVHGHEADGTLVTVLLDGSFKVTKTETGRGHHR